MSNRFPSDEPFAGSPKKAVLFETTYPGRCLAIFGLFFAFGSFVVVLMSMDLFREWRASNLFLEQKCVVLGKELIVPHFRGGYKPRITIRYTVNGHAFVAMTYDANDNWGYRRSQAQDILARFAIGQEYPCWYDPDEPAKAVLVRGYTWQEYLFGLIPLAVMIVTGLGMYACWLRLRTPHRMQSDTTSVQPDAREYQR